jgi:hypothetical protein
MLHLVIVFPLLYSQHAAAGAPSVGVVCCCSCCANGCRPHQSPPVPVRHSNMQSHRRSASIRPGTGQLNRDAANTFWLQSICTLLRSFKHRCSTHAVYFHLCHQVMLLCSVSTYSGGIAIKIQVTLAGSSGYEPQLTQNIKISSNLVFLTAQEHLQMESV